MKHALTSAAGHPAANGAGANGVPNANVGAIADVGANASPGALTLAELRPGELCRVIAVRAVDDPVFQRLLHMGLLRGREIEVVRRAPAGDPIEVRLLGYSLSLRRSEASLVEVERRQ